MFLLTYSKCDKKFNNINNLNRHASICLICRSVQRRLQKHDEINDEMIINVNDNNDQFDVELNQIDIDDSITIKSSKYDVEKFRQSLLKNKSRILSTFSSMRIKTYE